MEITNPTVDAAGQRKQRTGIVVSDRQDKTIVVRVDRTAAHRRYGKAMVRSKKFHAHDEKNSARTGDVVRIIETRPMSKLKRWLLAEVIRSTTSDVEGVGDDPIGNNS